MKNFTLPRNSALKTLNSWGKLMLALLLSLCFVQSEVYADVIGVDAGSATIESFNQTTWASISGPIAMTMPGFTIVGAQAVTWNSDNLLFYAIVTTTAPIPTARRLVTVDPVTGICTHIGNMGAAYSSLTYNSDLGIMYTMGGSGAPVGISACLFTVNITTGATTFLSGPYLIGSFGEVIAYNYDDDMIYHWSGDGGGGMEAISTTFPYLATPIVQSGDVHEEIIGAVYLGGGVFSATDLIFQGASSSFTITSTGVVDLITIIPYRVRGFAFIDPVLPVELTSFTSVVSGNDVKLNWSTSSETNNSAFNIERKILGGSWSPAGSVSGNGTTTSAKNYSFTDLNLNSGNYTYRLKQIDYNGNSEYFKLVNEVIIGVPEKFELSQNYPNPFNPSTTIDFQLPKEGNVNISVYDNSGKEVMILINEFRTAGYYSFNLNASHLSSGIYFYKISINDFNSVRKMMLVK